MSKILIILSNFFHKFIICFLLNYLLVFSLPNMSYFIHKAVKRFEFGCLKKKKKLDYSLM